VTGSHRGDHEAGSGTEVANLGIVRPPLVYLTSTGAGLAIQHAWPLRLLPPGLSAPLGAAVTTAAVVLFLSAVRTFRRAGTPVPGNRPTTTVVRAGPYRHSRNPIYLSFSLLQLGIAFWVNGIWPLVTLIPAVLLMSLVVIPREEAFLEARFPSEYLPYKNSVRRWL
jgi:protein-S-isoprenylcysteine O-methyltransferase Ste14